MSNLYDIKNYRGQLMKSLCTSNIIVELLHLVDEQPRLNKELMYYRIFPYLFVPEVSEEGQSYICFDFDIPSVVSDTVKNIGITVLVMSHLSLLRLPHGGGLRTDALAAEVSNILVGSSQYGIGAVKLQSVVSLFPNQSYHARKLRFLVQDVNNTLCDMSDWI